MVKKKVNKKKVSKKHTSKKVEHKTHNAVHKTHSPAHKTHKSHSHSTSHKSHSTKKAYANEREIAMDFAVRIQEKFDRIVKASILFGSQAKDTSSASSDIDIILIIDDTAITWDLELIAWYREELGKLIASSNYGKELHINTIKLSTWWQDLMYGDPVVINIIRYGEVLIDVGGFFAPLKGLLQTGRIRSTHEAVYRALQRAPTHLLRSRASIINAVEGIYWTMIDSAQAALMVIGKLPPSPEHVPGMLNEFFVEKKMLHPRFFKAVKEVYYLHKGITRGSIKEIKGEQLDKWQDTAEEFMKEMIDIVNRVMDNQKK